MKRTAIILTATVRPNSVLVLKTCPKERAEEYAVVLEHCCQFGTPVHFLENSGFDLESVPALSAAISHALVKVHRFPPSKGFERGKGYQEFEMMDAFIENHRADFDSILKISGRYLLQNITDILMSWEKCTKAMMVDMHAKMKVAITGVFACDLAFYKKNLTGLYLSANDSRGRFIEHVLYEELMTDNSLKTVLFPINPILHGTSGSYGASLQRHPVKMKMRNVERKVLHSLGKSEFPVEY